MPPKKRKQNFDHDKVTIGRAKIRKGEDGKQLVNETPRKNILLFLEKLSDEEAKNYSGRNFQSKLAAAVSGAADPVLGPEAVIDLHNYGYDDTIVFANKQGGQLMAALLSMLDDGGEKRLAEMQNKVDEQKKKADDEESKKDKVEQTLAYLQSLIPLSRAGRRDLAETLESLDGPLQDAGWLYGVLWGATLQWMDVRLRQVRAYGKYLSGTPPKEPDFLQERIRMINGRIHGGNLRVDAIITRIKFGDHRHADANYDKFFLESFKRMYHLSKEDGYWLAKHGDDIHRGVDWPQIIGFIDKFVCLVDRVKTGGDNLPLPGNFQDVHDKHFQPLMAHVTALITKANSDKDWQADAADLATLKDLQDAVYKGCQTWRYPNDRKSLWDRAKEDVLKIWPPADWLRDVATAQPRTAGKTGATMKLRPKARVKYTP
ncbi:hypothetical protein diail_7852 [Diaporthe ilicicola]|nr:hypothetical protein diail_7852 [Diaporthe ilicicola]